MSAYDSGGMLVMSIELPHDSADEPCPTDCMYVFIIEVVESLETMVGIIEPTDMFDTSALGGLMIPNIPFWQCVGTPQ